MRARPIIFGLLAVCVVAAWLAARPEDPAAGARLAPQGARYGLDAQTAERAGLLPLTPGLRRKALRFAPGVHPLDQRAVLDAVASARPEARQLIGLVDGLVTVDVGALEGQAVGRATERSADYEVTLDLGRVSSRFGQRGISNVVLHELAHVVDFALVTDDLLATVDAGTPVGYGCENGRGGCAPREERFADSFAKWATGDIGVDLYLGYQVPPPSSAWGEPLVSRLGP
jgi:hypothetical protein